MVGVGTGKALLPLTGGDGKQATLRASAAVPVLCQVAQRKLSSANQFFKVVSGDVRRQIQPVHSLCPGFL